MDFIVTDQEYTLLILPYMLPSHSWSCFALLLQSGAAVLKQSYFNYFKRPIKPDSVNSHMARDALQRPPVSMKGCTGCIKHGGETDALIRFIDGEV